MTSATFDGVTVELTVGDITWQEDLDAVVNAANAQLTIGGGVAGAIHQAAGPGLDEECRPLAPISPGQAVITSAHELPNDHVIHVLGPVHGVDEPSDELLARGYRRALLLAEGQELVSVGFPAISTGAFGYPMEEAARIALAAIRDMSRELSSVELVRFVLFDERALAAHEAALAELDG